MKKLIICILLTIIPSLCIAPVISASEAEQSRKELFIEFLRQRYNRELDRFARDLGYKESSNNWKTMNSINCMGEYQFAYSTLKRLGYSHITPKSFLKNPGIFPPEMQLEALRQLIKLNSVYLSSMNKYIGKTIKNVLITRSGLIAGAHLGGIGGVRRFLETDGAVNRQDMNGTRISDYIKEFAFYKI